MAYLVRTNKARIGQPNLKGLHPRAFSSSSVPQTCLITSQFQHIGNRQVTKEHQKRAVQLLRQYVACRKSSTTPKMMATSAALKQTLTPTVLEEVRNFWFGHVDGEDALILPSQNDMKRWFMRDADFDQACVAQFQPVLEAILKIQASATDIIEVIDQSSSLQWLSILLLLDQVPRNCFRGDEAKKVFELFDPLAVEVATCALAAGVPIQSSEVRYRFSYRIWFYLPLMHSENLTVHEKAILEHEGIARDFEEFLQKDVNAMSDDEKACYSVLSVQQDALNMWLGSTSDFEKKHKNIIEQFGRYPHRNEALNRVSTQEEIDYLNNGGETFS